MKMYFKNCTLYIEDNRWYLFDGGDNVIMISDGKKMPMWEISYLSLLANKKEKKHEQ